MKRLHCPGIRLFRFLYAFFFMTAALHSFLLSQQEVAKGHCFIRNFSFREYDHAPQNWGFVQAPNGLMYVANHAGILEYDGVTWKIIYVPQNRVRSLDISDQGIIYIGGKNELGFLAKNSAHGLEYRSLKHKIPENDRGFTSVWKTYALGDWVYFFCTERFFCFYHEQMTKLESESPVTGAFQCNGELLIHMKGKGLGVVREIAAGCSPGAGSFATSVFI